MAAPLLAELAALTVNVSLVVEELRVNTCVLAEASTTETFVPDIDKSLGASMIILTFADGVPINAAVKVWLVDDVPSTIVSLVLPEIVTPESEVMKRYLTIPLVSFGDVKVCVPEAEAFVSTLLIPELSIAYVKNF